MKTSVLESDAGASLADHVSDGAEGSFKVQAGTNAPSEASMRLQQVDGNIDPEANSPAALHHPDARTAMMLEPATANGSPDDERAQSTIAQEAPTGRDPSSGRQVVRQVLEWIGDDESGQDADVDTAEAVLATHNPPEQGNGLQNTPAEAAQTSVVEQEQALHLSIGSIVLTVEGPPSEGSAQQEVRRDPRPAPLPDSEPPVRLSRHYLRTG